MSLGFEFWSFFIYEHASKDQNFSDVNFEGTQPKIAWDKWWTLNNSSKSGRSLHSYKLLSGMSYSTYLKQPFVKGGSVRNHKYGILYLKFLEYSDAEEFAYNIQHSPSPNDPITQRGNAHCDLVYDPHTKQSFRQHRRKMKAGLNSFCKIIYIQD